MAELVIDVKVNGQEKIDALDQSVKKVETSTQTSTVSMVKWGAALTAVVATIGVVVSAGRDYQEQLNKMTGETDALTASQEDLSTSFGQMAQRMLDSSGATSIWTEATQALDGVMLHLTSFITGESIPALVAEQEAVQNVAQAKKDAKIAAKELAEHEKALNAVWETSAEIKARVKVFTDQEKIDKAILTAATNEATKAQEAENREKEKSIEISRQKATALTEEISKTMENTKYLWQATAAIDAQGIRAGETASNMADFATKTDIAGKQADQTVSSVGKLTSQMQSLGAATYATGQEAYRTGQLISSALQVSYPSEIRNRGLTSMHTATTGMATGGVNFGTGIARTSNPVYASGYTHKMTMGGSVEPPKPVSTPTPTPPDTSFPSSNGNWERVSPNSDIATYNQTKTLETIANKLLSVAEDILTVNRQQLAIALP